MENTNQRILGKLEAQNPRKRQQEHRKIPSRRNLKSNQTYISKDKQIEQLNKELQQLN